MNFFIVEGTAQLDGRYPFDQTRSFTTHEWGLIKRRSGYLPATFDEGIEGVDAELLTTLAVIAMHWAKKITWDQVNQTWDTLADGPFGTIVQLETEPNAEEADARPPDLSSSGSTTSSGNGSQTSSDPSLKTQNGTGDPSSVTSGSEPETSAT